jgi:hypothetical protein
LVEHFVARNVASSFWASNSSTAMSAVERYDSTAG